VANLLLQSDAEDSPVKIIDFGSLVQLDRASRTVVTEQAHGSPMSMAPESLPCFSREYSTASDVWQAGCVLF
jgi:serine/threonine protein kinase